MKQIFMPLLAWPISNQSYVRTWVRSRQPSMALYQHWCRRVIYRVYCMCIQHGREGYALDLDVVIDAAAEHGVCIEINAHPSRLDLDWRYLHRARDKGIKIPIDPDAHVISGLDDMRFGIGIARKGWLRTSDVLNTMTTDDLLDFFGSRRSR